MAFLWWFQRLPFLVPDSVHLAEKRDIELLDERGCHNALLLHPACIIARPRAEL